MLIWICWRSSKSWTQQFREKSLTYKKRSNGQWRWNANSESTYHTRSFRPRSLRWDLSTLWCQSPVDLYAKKLYILSYGFLCNEIYSVSKYRKVNDKWLQKEGDEPQAPMWELRVEGRLVDEAGNSTATTSTPATTTANSSATSRIDPKTQKRKFSSFFKSLVIELDKDIYGPDSHLVEVGWVGVVWLWWICIGCTTLHYLLKTI